MDDGVLHDSIHGHTCWPSNGEDIYNVFSRFDTVQECDGQTEGRTDILRQHTPLCATPLGKILVMIFFAQCLTLCKTINRK